MNTLEERLERGGYAKQLEENERDKRLVENAKRECGLRGTELSPEMRKFEDSVREVDAALAAEYEATVRLVDSRNNLELELLQMQERLEISAEECEETDPERAAKIRSLFGNLGK